MMPTETIRGYLPHHFAPYAAGQPADRLGAAVGGLPELGHGDTLRVALTRELIRLLTGGWAGPVVLPGGQPGPDTTWLIRLVRTADPATRAGTSAPSSPRRRGTRSSGSDHRRRFRRSGKTWPRSRTI